MSAARQQAALTDARIKSGMLVKQTNRAIAKLDKQMNDLDKQVAACLKAGKMEQARQKAQLKVKLQESKLQMESTAQMAAGFQADIEQQHLMLQTTQHLDNVSRLSSWFMKRNDPERSMRSVEEATRQIQEQQLTNSIYREAMTQRTGSQVNDEVVDEYLAKMADSVGVSLGNELSAPSKADPAKESATTEPSQEAEDELNQRLKALRAI